MSDYPTGATLPEVLTHVDAGRLPFTDCPTCKEMTPASVDFGPFASVTACCGRCKTFLAPVMLRFLTTLEAKGVGWRMSDIEPAAVN